MKHAANLIVVLVWAGVCVAVACYDAICEGCKKLRLGKKYEGPLEP